MPAVRPDDSTGSPAKPPRARRWLWTVVPVAGFLVTVAALLRLIDLPAVAETLHDADRRWVSAALVLALAATVLTSLRLWLFLRAAGEPRSWRRCWSAIMASLTLNAVLPSRGGDLVKAVFLTEPGGATTVLLGVVLLERVLDVLVLGLFSFAAAVVTRWHTALVPALVVTLAPCIALLVLRFSRRVPFWTEKFERLGRATRCVAQRKGYLSAAILLACLAWFNNICILACLLRGVSVMLPFERVLAAGPLAILAGIIPVSLSGVGTRDGALVLLLRDVAEPPAVLAAGVLYTVVAYWFLAVLGIVALGRETLRTTRAAARRAAQSNAVPSPSPS